jgi:pimeloyl-ACP methyl ester carboxylesterase
MAGDRFVMSEISPDPATVSAPLPDDPNSLAAHASASGVAPAGEACPPPLIWQEVLGAYHSDSQPWELDRGSRRLVGRTWGQGPPLYLLNGFAATAELYALLIWLLRESFRCVVFDTSIQKTAKRNRFTVSDYSEDLLAAMDHHGDPAACVFAPTSGSVVALQAAIEHPERIAGLVLQHGFASRRLSWSERLLAAWCGRSNCTLNSLPWRRRIQELNHRRWFPPFDGTRFEFLVDSTGRIPLAELAQKALAIGAVRLEDRLPQVQCPVLLVRTEGQGHLEAAGHDALERGLPDSRSEWLHSAGLHPYLTHPHRLAKLIKPFFLGDL